MEETPERLVLKDYYGNEVTFERTDPDPDDFVHHEPVYRDSRGGRMLLSDIAYQRLVGVLR
jgi:hypothetical protein